MALLTLKANTSVDLYLPAGVEYTIEELTYQETDGFKYDLEIGGDDPGGFVRMLEKGLKLDPGQKVQLVRDIARPEASAEKAVFKYAVQPLTMKTAPKVIKIVNGAPVGTTYDFEFTLEANGAYGGDVELAEGQSITVSVNCTDSGASAQGSFADVTFHKENEDGYSFTVTESSPSGENFSFWADDGETRPWIIHVVNNNGQLEKLSSDTDTVEFINNYYERLPGTGDIQPEVKVELIGSRLQARNFNFSITNTHDTDLQGKVNFGNGRVASNEADGTICFPPAIFSEPGTYSIEIRQDIPSEKHPNIDYDEGKITLTYEVVEDLNSGYLDVREMSGVKQEEDGETVARGSKTFTNVASVKQGFTVQKLFTSMDNGSTITDWASYKGWSNTAFAAEVSTDVNNKNVKPDSDEPIYFTEEKPTGEFNFTFFAEGTYTFTVSEVLPGPDDSLPGVSYDYNLYEVVIRVRDSGGGNLIPTVLVDGTAIRDGEPAVTIKNMYSVNLLTVPINALKMFNGAPSTRMFRFRWVRSGAQWDTVYNNADGKIVFGILFDKNQIDETDRTLSYECTLTEIADNDDPDIIYDDTSYTVTIVVVEDEGDGPLKAQSITYKDHEGRDRVLDLSVGDLPTFYNYSKSQPGGIQPEVRVELIGSRLKDRNFAFNITSATIDRLADKVNFDNVTGSVFNDAAGMVRFPSITFNEPGTYTIDIEQTIPYKRHPNIDYDAGKVTLTYEVVENYSSGRLDVTEVSCDKQEEDGETVTLGSKTFTNMASVDASFTVTKTFLEKNAPKTDWEGMIFAAKVASLDNAGKVRSLNSRDTAEFTQNSQSEPFKFRFFGEGDYTFEVTEVIPDIDKSVAGVTYDTNVYEVVIRVTDHGGGDLSPAVLVGGISSSEVTIKNIYGDDDGGTGPGTDPQRSQRWLDP